MAQRRLLVSLLIAATLVVDLAVLAGAPMGQRFGYSSLRDFAFPALAISQISLIAVLAALGPIPLPSGLVCLVLVALGLSGLYAGSADHRADIVREFQPYAVILLIQALVSFTASLTARAMGTRVSTVVPLPMAKDVTVHGVQQGSRHTPCAVRFVCLCSGGRHAERVCHFPGRERLPKDCPDRPRFQFTLGRMFEWITCTAIILAVVRTTLGYGAFALYGHQQGPLAVVYLGDSALALVSAWTVLTPYRAVRSMILLGLTAAAVAGISRYALSSHVGEVVAFVLLQLVWLVAALAVLRVAGYRLVRHRLAADEPAPAQSA